MNDTKTVTIVGAGLAGLACAVRLHDAGVDPILLEACDAVGGRVRTDAHDGFLLDHGFQVYLNAYPRAGQLLDLEALDLRKFRPGALVFEKGKLRRLMDVFRCPQHLPGTALQPIGTLKDKLLVGWLRLRTLRSSDEVIWNRRDTTTEEHLRASGFSEGMIDSFFRAFYGGIFLERELRTSSRMFEFTFKMFSKGSATLPARGMGQIPRQIAQRLPNDSIRLRTAVQHIERNAIALDDGSRIHADAVVVATDGENASKLIPESGAPAPDWRSTVTLYFSAPQSPLNEPIIALRGNAEGIVNNVSVPSDLSPHYAPEGKALISVSVLGNPDGSQLVDRVRNELAWWFGDKVNQWDHLASYRIRKALPEQLPSMHPPQTPFRIHHGIYVCGDHCSTASIEGAVHSGHAVADAILARR